MHSPGFTGPSALTVNIVRSITNLSIVVQWDAVDDSLDTTYTVTWNDGGDFHGGGTVQEQTSYTIAGLTLDTVYTINVAPANTCGDGPDYTTIVTFSTATTSTTISPTLTASTNTVPTVNPSSTTTAIVDGSSNTMNTPIITTTDSVTTTVRTDSSTKTTVVETNMTSISPSTTTATTADETSKFSSTVI